MSEGEIRFERRGEVGWITLHRPAKRNALAGDMRERLRRRIAAAATDDAVRALVVTGAGGAFCAGGDVRRMAELHQAGDEAGFRELLHAGVEVVLALQAFPGLTVAAVDGVAAGAGLSLALACDLRIGSERARFGATWGRLGLVPDWGASFWLPRLLGPGPALELILSGRLVEAEEALDLGLLHRLVPAGELAGTAAETARELGASRQAVAEARALVRGGIESTLEHAMAREVEAQEACFGSDAFAEGVAAFLEDRPPRPGDR